MPTQGCDLNSRELRARMLRRQNLSRHRLQGHCRALKITSQSPTILTSPSQSLPVPILHVFQVPHQKTKLCLWLVPLDAAAFDPGTVLPWNAS